MKRIISFFLLNIISAFTCLNVNAAEDTAHAVQNVPLDNTSEIIVLTSAFVISLALASVVAYRTHKHSK